MDAPALVVAVMRAGLAGQPMPNLGPQLPRDLLALINAVYDEARNWNAGQNVRGVRA